MLLSLLEVKPRLVQRGILAVPLVLWVSLYRIFYMGRVFDFVGCGWSRATSAWLLVILTTQVLYLFCFGDQVQAAQTPLLLNLPSTVPLVPSACQALAQLCRGAG